MIPWKDWRAFQLACEKGLKIGQEEYGDETMEGPLVNVLEEAKAECRDLAVYAFMAWRRLEVLRHAISGVADVGS